MTKDRLDFLKALVLDFYTKYLDAEKNLWDKWGFFKKDSNLYKAYKRAKYEFRKANENWENALLEYIMWR